MNLLPDWFYNLRPDRLLNPVRLGVPTIGSILYVVVSLSLCASANAAPHTIQPQSPLPALTDPVVINGTTSADYVDTPVIVLDGSLAGATTNGLTIEGGNSTVRGLVVQNFTGAGIRLDLLGGNTVAGNYVGTDATGTLDAGNGTHGIYIYGPSTGNTIGGTNTADRNLVSGNDGSGISADQSGSNIIQGNYVGTTAGGSGAIGNANTGIVIFQADGNIVGGTAAGAGNVVSGNGENGFDLSTASTNTTIQGNRIGTNAAGTGSLGNGHHGIHLAGSTSQIGGTVTGAGNLISGNGRNGLHIQGPDNTVEGNFIGTDVTGTSDRNNSWAGIGIEGLAYDNLIGGTTAGAGNIIAFNGRQGLIITGTSAVGNRVSGNSIHSNVAMGIDLATDLAVTPNDVGDADIGANNLQNFPVLDAAVTDGATNVAISGSLNSATNTIFRLEFFSNTAVDASGNGEGKTYLGYADVVTDASGDIIFNEPFSVVVAIGDFITVTATDPNGNTSEFGEAIEIQSTLPAVVQLNSIPLEVHPLLPGGPADDAMRLNLVNLGLQPETLNVLAISNSTTGPGTVAQLDNDWQNLSLLVDGNGQLSPPNTSSETAVTSGVFNSGYLAFTDLDIALAPGDTTQLVVQGQASLTARDGDLLSIQVSETNAVAYSGASTSLATWPLVSERVLAVDGMVADQLDLHPVNPSQFMAGSVRNLALDVGLPANGYEGDQLDRLNTINIGNARNAEDIAKMEAWADNGDGVFDLLTDSLLGEYVFSGSRWELTGLSHVVPLTGLRIFVTVDIAETAIAGRTVQLGLPTLPDVGIGMASGNDGPIDREVINPFAQAISVDDRIILTTGVVVPGTVAPGQTDVLLLHLVAFNTYSVDRQLTGLIFTNGTDGPGAPTTAERDGELALLTLRADGDGNGELGDLISDPVIATGGFSDGEVSFTGLTWALLAGNSNHLFLTGDVSLAGAADGDVISAHIAGGIDLDFATTTAVAASWPLDSGANWTVDGMVVSQIDQTPTPLVTLAPGEGPTLVMDFVVPANGYAADNLLGLRFVNQGTASESDFADFRLWSDGGDGVFSAGGGDDVELGPCVWVSDSWYSPILNASLLPGGRRIFVGLTVGATPTDAATVRLAVPVNGITVASGNSGPRDLSLVNPNSSLLSTAPLLSEVRFLTQTSTVGQSVTVRMRVRNVGTEDLLNVAPQALISAGDGVLIPVAGPLPPSFNLAVGAVDSVTWTYLSDSTGVITLTGNAQGTGAISSTVRSSLASTSGEHRIVDPADNLELYAAASMPLTIVSGQIGVAPLTLTFINPGGLEGADALIHSLRISLKDDAGGGVIPADLLTRVVVLEGGNTYLEKTILETSGDEIDLTLAEPIAVTGQEPVSLSLKLDIHPAAAVPAFMVEVEDSTCFEITDAISNAPVPVVLQDEVYPIQSGLGVMLVEASGLSVTATTMGPQQVGFGQQDVTLLKVTLLNPGTAGLGSEVRVGSLALGLTDTLGTPVAVPSQMLKSLRVTSPLQTLRDILVAEHDSTFIVLDLSSPLTVPVDTPLDLTIVADIADPSLAGAVRARLQDASSFLAFDGNSGAVVPVTYGTDPMVGETVNIQETAADIMVAGTPLLPTELVIGARDVPAIEFTFRHPGTENVAEIVVESLRVQSRTANHDLVSPTELIDQMVIMHGSLPVGIISNPTGNGNMIIPLAGVTLQPGETVTLTLRLDVEAAASSGSLQLMLPDDGLVARDVNLGLAVLTLLETGEEFPLTSGITQLQEPADETLVGFTSLMPTVLSNSTSEIPVAQVSLRVPDGDGVGGVTLTSLSVRAADDRQATLAMGIAAEQVFLYHADQLWADSGPLVPGDTLATLVPLSTILLSPGENLDLEMRAIFRAPATVSTLRLGLTESDIQVVQPDGGTTPVRVEAEDGFLFPYWTETGSFTGASLADSYSNFPNPFHPDQGPTTFVFALPRQATVSLKLLTGHNRTVISLIENEARPAGLYQHDAWNGRNGRGVVVQNGVYIAELTVVYADGSKDRILRKVAVVR